jgi:hypothetical protein
MPVELKWTAFAKDYIGDWLVSFGPQARRVRGV